MPYRLHMAFDEIFALMFSDAAFHGWPLGFSCLVQPLAVPNLAIRLPICAFTI